MLVLSRRINEKIVFPTFDTTVQVVGVRSGLVRLGIDAPSSVTILRAELQERPRGQVLGRKAKALLVEDNANECELLAIILRMAGIQVDTAGDGADALDYLRNNERPDVVLLDMGLPRCDGATTVREIRRDPTYSNLKIFAVTGRSEDEFDLARGPTGVNRWFQKPLDPVALLHDLNQEIIPCHSGHVNRLA